MPASVSQGACDVFPRPETAKYGLGPIDQAWIDETVEAGVAGCGWARPTALAQLPPAPAPAAKAAPKPKKKHWWQRKPKTPPAPPST